MEDNQVIHEVRTKHWVTVRLTASEKAALLARVGTNKGAISEAVREAIKPLVQPVEAEATSAR